MKYYVEYKRRLLEALKETVLTDGIYKVKVQIFDLLEATEDKKSDFYSEIFRINRHVETLLGIKQIVFYPKNKEV